MFLIVELEKGEIKKASLRRIFASDGLMVEIKKTRKEERYFEEEKCF